jgi:TonB family protein
MPAMPTLGKVNSAAADSQRVALSQNAASGSDAYIACIDTSGADTVGVTLPARLSGPLPTYPAWARSQGLQGWVALQFVIARNGHVESENVLVLGASDPTFIEPALYVVRNEVFTPARKDGKPVRAIARQYAEFRLKGSRLW